MHLSFVGGLPKRDGSILWYHSQHLLEQALTKGDPLHGCVTDLQKFFNGIPRPFLRQLMIRFGLPECLVESWLTLLGTLKRSVVVQDSYSLPRRATCGVPEGDPLSVVAAVMIGAQLHWAITRDVPAQPLIYIDNIEIIAQDEADIHMATDIALDFFCSIGFQSRPGQILVMEYQTSPSAGKTTFGNKNFAVNLGCAMNYKKSNKHGEFKHRLFEGARRAKIIASLPLPQVARMEAVKGGPFAAACYGSEVHYVGERSIAQLRREVASIVAKPHRGLCPKAWFWLWPLGPQTSLDFACVPHGTKGGWYIPVALWTILEPS